MERTVRKIAVPGKIAQWGAKSRWSLASKRSRPQVGMSGGKPRPRNESVDSAMIAAAIIAESTLTFLGLGFPPDIPTWGRLLFDAKDHLDFAPHWAIFPGTAIFLTVL